MSGAGAGPAAAPRPPLGKRLAGRLGPVGQRDFGLLWLAATLSLIGDYTFRVAFITYIITATHSAGTLALATTALLVPPLVFYLIGGVAGDRARSRKRVLIAADLLRFAAVAAMTVTVATDQAVAVVILLALVIGVGDGFFQPTSFAFLTEIVDKDQLVAANSANSITRQIGIIAGPTLGGFLIGWFGAAPAFAFDAATFLASAALLAGIRYVRPTSAGSPPPRRRVVSGALDGLRYAAGLRWLLVTCLVGAVANAVFTGSLDVAVPLILAPQGADQAQYLGLYYTLQGVGALVGAVVLARFTITRVAVPTMGMLAVMAAALAMVGVLGSGPPAYLMAVAYGFGLHWFNSVYPSVVQQRVPSDLLSRVGSVVYLAFHGLMPLGTLIFGPLVAGLGARDAALWTGTAVAVLTLITMRTRAVRGLTLRHENQSRPAPAGT